jgi:hypothetical protein
LYNLVRVAAVCFLPWAAFGDVITFGPAPDLQASFFSADYTAGTLTSSGLAVSFTQYVQGVSTFYAVGDGNGGSGLFDFTADISSSGEASDGSFSITGCIVDTLGIDENPPACSLPVGLLLSGNLASFEYVPLAGGELDFGFTGLTGSLQSQYGDIAYIKMSLADFPGDFQTDFSTDFFNNQADIGVIATPEPRSGFLLLSGAAVLLFYRRRVFRGL